MTLMLKSVLCHYSDAYILAIRTIAVANTGTKAAANNREKNNIQKSYFIYWLHRQNKKTHK